MGLTIHYDWKTKADLPAARRLIKKRRALALKLPFDSVSEIYEQYPPDGATAFELYDHPFRQGDLYLSRKRDDGKDELVHVQALHAVFFMVHVRGAETIPRPIRANQRNPQSISVNDHTVKEHGFLGRLISESELEF